tara:strand:+ start:71 stop:1741 length:1671 start_codon:yes stop_codon:yes gene_type:complete
MNYFVIFGIMLGIYCRKSVANEEGKDRSINDQREKGKELSKSLGIDYEVYIDDGVSGTLPINKRPEFSRLIDNVNEGIITKVFVVDQSRLERSPEVRFTLNKIFEENNVELYTEGGKVGNDAESRAMGNIFSVINELYVELTKRKIKSVLKRNAQEGRAFSVNPYGYETDDKGMLTICKNEVEVVKKIYALSLKGIGTDKIAEILTKEGVPTRLKRAERWYGNTVRRIIQNTIYKGYKEWGRKESIKKNDPNILQLFYHSQLKIFDESYWQKVNDNLKNNANNSGKVVKHKYLLRKIVKCEKCSRNYYGRSRVSKGDNFYMCSGKRNQIDKCTNRSINIDFIEQLVWDVIINGALKAHIEEYIKHNTDVDKIEEIETQLVELDRESKDSKAQLSKLIDLALKGVFTDAEITGKKKVLLDKQNDIKIKIKNLKETKANLDSDLYTEQLDADIKADRVYSFDEKREIISRYIYGIGILYKQDVNHIFKGGEYFIKVQFQNADIRSMIFVARRDVKHYVNLPIWGSEGADWYPYKAYGEESVIADYLKEQIKTLKALKP